MPSTSTDRLAGLSTSVAVKAPVKAVAIANINLSGEQTVNGVAVVSVQQQRADQRADG